MGVQNSKEPSLTDLVTPSDPIMGNYLTTSGSNLTGESGASHAPFGNAACIKSWSAGVNHSLALLLDGKVVSWGSNQFAQLGFGRRTIPCGKEKGAFTPNPRFAQIPSGIRIRAVEAGFGHSAAVSENGELFTWGLGTDGQLGFELGNKDKPDKCMFKVCQNPTLVATMTQPVDQVACGKNFTIILTVSEQVYSCGAGTNGVLGHGNYKDITQPTYISGLQEEKVNKIVAGWSHVLAMTVDGKVFTWGNAFHEIDDKVPDLKTPTQVQELDGVKITDIACGNYHNVALDATLTNVYTWGGNGYGQLGIGQREEYLILEPINIAMETQIHKVFAGGNFSMALGANSSVFAWGSNKYRQLGPHIPVEVHEPVRLSESHGLSVRDIACGDSHMLISISAAGDTDSTMFAFEPEVVEGPFSEFPPDPRSFTEGSTRIVTPGASERQPSWGPVQHNTGLSHKIVETEPDMVFKH